MKIISLIADILILICFNPISMMIVIAFALYLLCREDEQ